MIIVPTEKRLDWRTTPVVLISILILNTLVFLFYQSNDQQKINDAITAMHNSGYIEREWPVFERYLEAQPSREEELDWARQAYDSEQVYWLAQAMLMDRKYYDHVQGEARQVFEEQLYARWRNERPEIQATFESVSSFAYGLKATDVSFTTLITHQFLHGDLGHLLGNMIFLLICGFAVEAAIGHLRFLAFYLLGGILAGVTQVVTNLGSDVPLVGASGAISGVMAMYLAVFRLKRIEFFYWIFCFAGYFRAPALMILPLYIGKEVYQYLFMEGSNVAYMAHAGGFVAGAILIGLSMAFNRNTINDDYIEQEQGISPRNQALADIYSAIENLQFDYARKQLSELIEREGLDFELAKIRYNLDKIKVGNAVENSFRELMTQKGMSSTELSQLSRLWMAETSAHNILPTGDQLQLAFRFTKLDDLTAAAGMTDYLYQQKADPRELLLLLQRVASRFSSQNNPRQAAKYQSYIQQLTKEGHDGVM